MNIELKAITYQPNYRDTTEQVRIIQAYKAGAMEMQKEYEEKLHWIPVGKELPKNYSAVLAVIKSPSCTWVEEIGYGEGKFHLPGRGDTDFVTHWMYLPEPPPFL